MAQPTKVLHTCETAMGGVGVYQKYLAGMDSRMVNQTFLMPEPHAGIMERDPRVVAYPMKTRGFGAVLSQIRHLLRAMRRERPDVVVFHSTFSLFALAAVRLLQLGRDRPRMLYLAHGWAGDQYTGLKAWLVQTVEGNLCGLADLVINVSQNDLETARKKRYRGRQVLIENAVPDRMADLPYDRFSDAPGKLHLLFVGRFDRQKGLDVLLDALARARVHRADLQLHVIGGAVRGASQAELPGDVHVIGWVPRDEVDLWYGSADVLVVPSRWEGLPLVLPEALRNGTPVLVSRRSGMANLLDEGVQGFSFDLEVDGLAKVLLSLDRAGLNEMRPACRALYEKRYSIERLYAQILDAYRDRLPSVTE